MVSRRQFVGWLAGAIPVGLIVNRAHAASVSHLAAAPETLDALGESILPSELGAAQIRRFVAGFRKWMADYRENAEVNHAYGNSRLRFTGPTPATRWTKQLDDLEASARAAHGSAFAALTIAQRQAIVRPLLAAERAIPGSPDGGTHVSAALLGFFYSSSDAADLCYEAAIGKNTCRALGDSPKRPAPRARATGGRVLPVRTNIEAGS